MSLFERIAGQRAELLARPSRVLCSLPILLGLLVACVALPAPAGAAVALTPDRYAALDALYTSSLPFDREHQSAKQLAAARAACRALDGDDPLLGPIRRSCTVDLRG